MKKLSILLLTVLMTLTLLGATPMQDEENDVEQLLDKASYSYGVLEDFPRALKYLERAKDLAGNSYLKADALVKTAYVYFLMGKGVSHYRGYLLEALNIDYDIRLEKIYFKERFINIFKEIKKEPKQDSKSIEIATVPQDLKWKRRGKFYLKVNYNYMMAADEGYSDLYGSSSMVPYFKAGFRMARYFYVWAGVGAMSASGVIEEVDAEAKTSQRYLLVGLNYQRNLTKRLGFKLEGSAVSVSYKEEALGLEIKNSALGFNFEGGLVLNLSKRFFTEFSAGYLFATDVVLEGKIRIGGFAAGLGMGMLL